jgi:glucosyl-dolichyl phosphate glucuronosyltransferase
MSERIDIDLLTGPNFPKFDVYPPVWLNSFWKPTPFGGKQCSELSLLDLGNNVIEIDAVFVWGLNFVIRKSAFESLKGFHPDVIPQNIQFLQGDGETGLSIKAKEAGMKALYHPNVMLYHLVPAERLTIGYFEKRYFYQGVSDSYTQIRAQNFLYKNNKTQIIEVIII